jgi:signal transduction histidine kinase
MEKEIHDTPGSLRDELDRQLFNLKTLYDVSHELLGLAEVNQILKNFLLMTMGNFGVMHGFLALQDTGSKEICRLQTVGIEEQDKPLLLETANRVSADTGRGNASQKNDAEDQIRAIMLGPPYLVVFVVDGDCRGLLGLGPKLVEDEYSEEDKELLTTLINSLVVSLKSARYSEALEEALNEVRAMNRAKDKVISHLSHELMTPIALVGGCLTQLEKRLSSLPSETWEKTLARANRASQRLSEIQYEATDIVKGKNIKTHRFMSNLLDQCADEIELLFEEETGESPIAGKIRQRIDELFGPKDTEPVKVHPDRFVAEKLEELRSISVQRGIELITQTDPTPSIEIPLDPLEKVVKGLIKNAIENTPDEGRIEVRVGNKGNHVEVCVKDYGVGIAKDDQARIFEGFYHIQDTMNYGSKKPFEFNAGGRGADLLRMKIFSERYNFKLAMTSSRCKFIPVSDNACPGRISDCGHCKSPEDCYQSGGTTFHVLFPIQ